MLRNDPSPSSLRPTTVQTHMYQIPLCGKLARFRTVPLDNSESQNVEEKRLRFIPSESSEVVLDAVADFK